MRPFCMKHKITDFDILQDCLFVDSVQVFKDFKRSGLDSLCQKFGLVRINHSVLKDVHLLKEICIKTQSVLSLHSYTFADLMSYLHRKLPVPIPKFYDWARNCRASKDLEMLLTKFVQGKSALSKNQVFKIAFWYFKDRFVVCK